MFLFQTNGVVSDAINRTFATNPDTVYGILVGLLLIIGLTGWGLYIRQNTELRNIVREQVGFEKELINAINNLDKNTDKSIKDVKEDIIRHIQDLTSRIR